MRVWFIPLLVAACAAGPTADPLTDPVRLTVQTDKAVYRPGEPIQLELALFNTGPTPVTYHFTSGQRYDFLIVSAAGDTVWRWAASAGFIQVLGTEELGPDEELFFGEAFRETLSPGAYTVHGMLTARDRQRSATAVFEVR